ncbi:hypothetical protein [Paraburkholderia aspalathi]|uniref:hypothetical protein n=1 Tax=Paraburkholderia aspalathi TaxID=1324617 RepID=UPI0038BC2582
MAIRLQAIPPEGMQILIGDFARQAVKNIGDREIDVRLLARAISVTLRHHGFLNARIDPDEFARACARAREDRS